MFFNFVKAVQFVQLYAGTKSSFSATVQALLLGFAPMKKLNGLRTAPWESGELKSMIVIFVSNKSLLLFIAAFEQFQKIYRQFEFLLLYKVHPDCFQLLADKDFWNTF